MGLWATFEAGFLCFGGQKNFLKSLKKHFSNRIEKSHKMAFIMFFFFEKVWKSCKNLSPQNIHSEPLPCILFVFDTNCFRGKWHLQIDQSFQMCYVINPRPKQDTYHCKSIWNSTCKFNTGNTVPNQLSNNKSCNFSF